MKQFKNNFKTISKQFEKFHQDGILFSSRVSRRLRTDVEKAGGAPAPPYSPPTSSEIRTRMSAIGRQARIH